ncbi:MAG TPA: isocitrate lyase/phosphoenolpyruvate mutase family protein [Candidatus Binatia bacterium]|nr:isocitrate lyase/phosphoenolpyruvate mutase family protein [Candidatus Binatia bacterium]
MPDAAETFRQLHRGPELLLLANCWDAGSARLLASLGARAVATTSAGVAWAHAHPDGDALPVDLLIATVGEIARAVEVPLTVDVESGYASDPATVGETVAALVDAGAVGINIEDGAGSPDLLAAKIARAKHAAARRGVDLFVNARTDVFLRGLAPESTRVAETLARAARYRDAGADGLFVPKVVARDEIREIASSAGLPLNVLAWPGLPPACELTALGVRRLSAGSAMAHGVWARAAALAARFLDQGRFEALFENAMPYPEINVLFSSQQ